VQARQGRLEEAEQTARAAVELAASTDSPNRRAESLLALADVLDLTGSEEEARKCVANALSLYEQKGNVAAAARVKQMREEPRAGLFAQGGHRS
jgi:Flp pilus assembly protein TadD